MASAHQASRRSQARDSTRCSHAARAMVIRPITVPLRRCECSANLSISVNQPCGLTEPLESGQSGKAMPAPMVVVKAPSATSTNTQALPMAANQARAGLYVAERDIRESDCGNPAGHSSRRGRANLLTIGAVGKCVEGMKSRYSTAVLLVSGLLMAGCGKSEAPVAEGPAPAAAPAPVPATPG